MLKLFGLVRVRNRAERQEGESGTGCEYSGTSNQLLGVALDSGQDSVLVELDLDDLLVGLNGGVGGLSHEGVLSNRGVSY